MNLRMLRNIALFVVVYSFVTWMCSWTIWPYRQWVPWHFLALQALTMYALGQLLFVSIVEALD